MPSCYKGKILVEWEQYKNHNLTRFKLWVVVLLLSREHCNNNDIVIMHSFMLQIIYTTGFPSSRSIV
jgi:hypothetical protein